MSPQCSRSACLPRASRSLFPQFALLLLLLLLTPSGSLADSVVSVQKSARELRCVCLTLTPGIHPQTISNLKVIAAGPQCPKVEVIATLKNGKEVCLDPEAPLIKKIVQKMLSSSEKRT